MSNKAIVYNVLKIDSGWRIQAVTPKGLSSSDRTRVIEWFKSYRSKLRELHPLWMTRFSAGEHGYALDIKPIGTVKELVEKGQDLKAIWTDEVASRA
jgi:hypothetical protein